MKYLIAGLGNIGEEYDNTRHNVGFAVVDQLSKELSGIFSPARLGDIATVKYKGRALVLLKPSTYMNLSGKAVRYWLQAEKISPNNLLVVTDDLALPFGKMRMRAQGNDGGHNGLKDINAALDSKNYPRLRFGVGSAYERGRQVDYVLGKWSEEEQKQLQPRLDHACEMIKAFVTLGVDRTMSSLNNK